jgi:hypothetical protein
MAFKLIPLCLAMSSSFTLLSPVTTATAVEIHSINDFKPYVEDHGYYVVEIDHPLSNNTYEIDMSAGAVDKGLHLVTAYDDSGLKTTLENNHLIWHSGNIGSEDKPVDAFLYTAFSDNGDLKNNSLSIQSGLFAPKIDNGSTYGRMVAARTEKGNLSGNSVDITGGTFFSNIEIIAAYSATASNTVQKATSNRVTIDGSTGNLAFRPYGDTDFESVGEHAASLFGAKMELADVSDNSVIITNLTSSSAFNGIVGAYSVDGDVRGNYVKISDSCNVAAYWTFGGQSYSDEKYTVTDGNAVEISNSKLLFFAIASSENYAGGAENGYVLIDSSTLIPMKLYDDPSENVSYVSGGLSYAGGTQSVSNNTIRLIDVTVDTRNQGSVSFIAGGNFLTNADVFNNKIILESTNDDFHATELQEADFWGAQTYLSFHDNALVLNRWKGQVASVQNFDSLVFQNFKWENGSTLLSVKGTADIESAKITVVIPSIRFDGQLENHFGEQMTLIQGSQNHAISFNPIYDNGQQIAIPSTITEDSIGVIQNNRDKNSVEFKLQGTAPSQQLELVSNNRNMSLFFVNHGAELILDNLDATSRDYHWGIRTFASIDGVQSNYSTDGHIDVHGFTAAAGWANSVMIDGNPLLLNLFVETGKGDYTEEMSYLNIDRRFSGNVKYYGAGISTRIKNQAGWYAEGSLRAGRTETEVSRGLVDGNGIAHGYELSGHYFGAHIGAGRIIDVGEKMKADLFMKYFYTYLPSDSTDIFADGIKNRFDFDSVDSSRVRVGARLYFPLQKAFWAYTGLAYQYDFSPEVHVDVNGEKITGGATMRGSMGIGSLGLRYKYEDSPWVLDLKVRGYVGQREGISGKAQVEYRY